MGENMIEVDAFARNAVAALFVAMGHHIGFLPKSLFIYLVSLEDGLLHVAGDERFVEIPDKRDPILGKQSVWHIRQERSNRSDCNGQILQNGRMIGYHLDERLKRGDCLRLTARAPYLREILICSFQNESALLLQILWR